jgi:hypothetical protein
MFIIAYSRFADVTEEDSALWVISCKDVPSKDEACHSQKYKDENDLASLARYIRMLLLPKFVSMHVLASIVLLPKVVCTQIN